MKMVGLWGGDLEVEWARLMAIWGRHSKQTSEFLRKNSSSLPLSRRDYD